MAMLQAAKDSKKDEDSKKPEDAKDKKKHKHKHAASPSASRQPEADEGDEGAAEDNAQEPGSESEGAEQQDGAEGATAPAPPQQPQAQDGQQDQGAGDAGGDQGQGDQPAQQGGTQGATPVPSPAAPGAGDTTSGGADTPDQDQDPNAQPPQTPGEDTAAGPGANTDLQQIPMSPGLKDEYDKANELLMQLLYKAGDDKLATGLVQGLMPQGPGKIKNAAMLSIQVVIQIHKKLNLPAQLILPFAKDVVGHVLDLGEQVKQIQYSDQESTAILGSVYEGALRIFGVTKGPVKSVAQHLGRSTLEAHQQKYQQAHAHAKPAIDANNAAWHHDHLAGQQGAPVEAGPQTGAPAGAQGGPQAPAPGGPQPAGSQPAQGPPPAGGMLSQAAAQPEGESNG
jgi:hypothetical protein